MIYKDRLLEVASPVATVFPSYQHDLADINEALDHGTANCAVRAYAGGLLLRNAYPNPNIYVVQFGFTADHGSEHEGANGLYDHMGHAATRFFIPGNRPMILESYTDSKLEVTHPSDAYEGYTWMDLDAGYRAYLDRAGLDDVDVNPGEILAVLLRTIADKQASNA